MLRNNPELRIEAYLKSGDHFGLSDIIGKKRRSATLVAREDCHLIKVRKEIFFPI
jgi:CRP-like cAMP-binding protein